VIHFRFSIFDFRFWGRRTVDDPVQNTIENRKSKIENLFLIGYRGSGKTTVARLLAEILGWDWIDADEALQKRHGRSIRAMFAAEGEAGFRDKEAALLEELCALRTHVIATGGGVVLREDNRQRLRAAGKVVWLSADAPTLWRRLQLDAGTAEQRPALTVGGLAEVEELLRRREPWYAACADWKVDTAQRSPDEVARAICTHLKAD
jgi:shikimate kinase